MIRSLAVAALLAQAGTPAKPAASAAQGATGPKPAASAAQPAPPAAQPGVALAALLKSVRADGPVSLNAAAQADVIALLPAPPRGQECQTAPKAIERGFGLRDRGDGAVLVAEIENCTGHHVFAFGTGAPPRVALLFDMEEGQAVENVFALNLRGGKRDTEIGAVVHAPPNVSDLHVFGFRGDSGFAFTRVGALSEYGSVGDCANHPDPAGWSSYVRVVQPGKLAVLRVDNGCVVGAWQASCVVYEAAEGGLKRATICGLPKSLDRKALVASGWK
jgi:hypothetical protein